MTVSERFVTPVSQIRYESLPAEVIEKTKLCVLHAFACVYAGFDARWSKAAADLAGGLYKGTGASIWFKPQFSNMTEAAFVNAVTAQSILHEDIHRDSNAHPGIIVIPAAFAAAEQLHCSGKRLIEAVAAGYEMMGRIGRGTACPEFGKRGFRPTSIIGTFGSAMAAGILLNLDTQQHLAAFGLAANFTCGINEWGITGTDDLYFQNGMASRNGIIAAQLASRGISAPLTILEGKCGVCNAYGFSLANLEAVNCLDGKYVINDVLFKPAPACALVQTTAQAALDAVKQGIHYDDIEKGTIYTFALGKSYTGCDNSGPFQQVLQARMSNQFNFAATMIHNKIANKNYLEYADSRVTALSAKLTLVADSGYTQMFPVKQPVRVELIMKNGRKHEIYREEPVYLNKEDIIGKMYDYCVPAYGKDGVENIINYILNLENQPDVNGLSALLRGSH